MYAKPINLIAFLIASLFFGGVNAKESGTEKSFIDATNSVNEMLRIDAQRAIITEQKMLAEAEGRLGGGPIFGVGQNNVGLSGSATIPEVKPTKPVAIPVRMEVLGIFGLGEKLFADVAIDNVRVRFKSGQSFPLGISTSFPYRLVSINVPCIKIAEANKTVHNICLSKSGL